jgi:hypothetical protein
VLSPFSEETDDDRVPGKVLPHLDVQKGSSPGAVGEGPGFRAILRLPPRDRRDDRASPLSVSRQIRLRARLARSGVLTFRVQHRTAARHEGFGEDGSGGKPAPLPEDAVLRTARSAGASAVGTGKPRKTSQMPFWGFTLNFDDIGIFCLHGFQLPVIVARFFARSRESILADRDRMR